MTTFTMEVDLSSRVSVPEMYQKPQPLSFLGRRSFMPRPMSDATEIFDTDIEDEEEDDDAYDSPVTLDSASTRSSFNEIHTPRMNSGLDGYEFHFDAQAISGPYGPHLFQPTKQQEEAEIFISMSPLALTPKPISRNITSLNTAVAELDEFTVRSWTPEQVAEWMDATGFDSAVVDKFLAHDICGTVLLDLQFEDLKELDISSFGKRHQVMTSIRQLRESTLITPTLARNASHLSRTESHRRGRHPKGAVESQGPAEDITPAESISIVAIEQILPKLHKCSKGEDCTKWQKQQLKIQRMEAEFAADMKSVTVPSLVGSSDVLGPSQGMSITTERLSTIQPRDPLESVRNFLDFQHVNSPTMATSPPQAQFTQNLNGLPKLTIPMANRMSDSPFPTPISAFHNPTEQQAKLRAELQQDPYHYGGVASPVDVYRIGTPMSCTDVPITAIPIDPVKREVCQSVPPEMRYGTSNKAAGESINRPSTTQPSPRRNRRPSFVPNMTALHEDSVAPSLPPVTSEADLVNHKGWMRKRKTTRVVKHEWQNNYFTLDGTQLGMSRDEISQNLESIDVDEYTLHAYAKASSSKLSAAFKKSMGNGAPEPTFAFSLIPEGPKNKKFFEKDRGHHFAVNSGTDRVEWMRKLMLAKALKKNDGQI